MKQHNNRRPSVKLGLSDIVLRLALILLCLTMVSFHMMGSLFARYSSTAEASDEARVAKFDVKVTGNTNVTVDCLTTDNGTCVITVQNDSEVAVKYDILLGYEETPYLSLSFNEAVTITYPDTSHIMYSSSAWKLAPGATGAHTLVFTVDWDLFTEEMSGASASETRNFTITVHIEQVN